MDLVVIAALVLGGAGLYAGGMALLVVVGVRSEVMARLERLEQVNGEGTGNHDAGAPSERCCAEVTRRSAVPAIGSRHAATAAGSALEVEARLGPDNMAQRRP